MRDASEKLLGVGIVTFVLLSVVAGHAGVAGASTAANLEVKPDYDFDEPVTSGELRYRGSDLFFQAAEASDANAEYDLRYLNASDEGWYVGRSAMELSLDDNATTVIGTGDLNGRYVIVDQDGNPVNVSAEGKETGSFDPDKFSSSRQASNALRNASFEVVPEPLTASFDEETARQNTTSLDVQYGVDEYELTVSARNLDTDTLLGIFDGRGPSVNDQGEVTFGVDGESASIDADFEGVSPGTYTFEIGVNGTDQFATAEIEVAEARDVSPTFETRDTYVRRGGIAEIPINVDRAAKFRVTLGFDGVRMNQSIEVLNGANDDVVTLEVNTFTLGRYGNGEARLAGTPADAVSTASENDEVLSASLAPSEPLSEPAEPGFYPLNVTVDGNETDFGRLFVTEPALGDVRHLPAPAEGFDDDVELSTVRDHARSTDGGSYESVATGDVLVTEIQDSSAFGVLESGLGPTTEETLLAVNGSALAYSLTQVDPASNREAARLNLTRTVENDGVRVFVDRANGTAYLLTWPDRMVFESGDEPEGASAGERYRVRFGLLEDGGPVPDDRIAASEIDIASRTVSLDTRNGVLEARPEADYSITGATTLAPGSEIWVRAYSRGERPFMEEATVEVRPDRTFDAPIDFSSVPVNTNFTARAIGFEESEVEGLVGAPLRASISLGGVSVTDGRVEVDSVDLSHGGFVVIHRNTTDGEVLGVSDHIPAGDANNVKIDFGAVDWPARLVAVPYYDRDGDRQADFPDGDTVYRENGDPVSDRSGVIDPQPTGATDPSGSTGGGEGTSDGQPATDDGSAAETAAPTTAATPAEDPGPTDTPADEEEPSEPGLFSSLGLIAYAVFAFLVIATLVFYRN